MLREYQGITPLHQDERKGKCAAMNRAIHYTTEPLMIFSDANNLLNKDCIRTIAKHYTNTGIGGFPARKK